VMRGPPGVARDSHEGQTNSRRESLAWYNVAAAGRPAIVQRSRAPLRRMASVDHENVSLSGVADRPYFLF
jgi:hypothetical protein